MTGIRARAPDLVSDASHDHMPDHMNIDAISLKTSNHLSSSITKVTIPTDEEYARELMELNTDVILFVRYFEEGVVVLCRGRMVLLRGCFEKSHNIFTNVLHFVFSIYTGVVRKQCMLQVGWRLYQICVEVTGFIRYDIKLI